MTQYSHQLVMTLGFHSEGEHFLLRKWKHNRSKVEDFSLYSLEKNCPFHITADSIDRYWSRDIKQNPLSLQERLQTLNNKSRIYIVGHGSAGSATLSHLQNANLHITANMFADILTKGLNKNNLQEKKYDSRKLKISLISCEAASGKEKIIGGSNGIPIDSFAYKFIHQLNLSNINCEVIARRLTVTAPKENEFLGKLTNLNNKLYYKLNNSKVTIYFENNNLVVKNSYEFNPGEFIDSIISEILEIILQLNEIKDDKKSEIIQTLFTDFKIKTANIENKRETLQILQNMLKTACEHKIISNFKDKFIYTETSTYGILKFLLDKVERHKQRYLKFYI